MIRKTSLLAALASIVTAALILDLIWSGDSVGETFFRILATAFILTLGATAGFFTTALWPGIYSRVTRVFFWASTATLVLSAGLACTLIWWNLNSNSFLALVQGGDAGILEILAKLLGTFYSLAFATTVLFLLNARWDSGVLATSTQAYCLLANIFLLANSALTISSIWLGLQGEFMNKFIVTTAVLALLFLLNAIIHLRLETVEQAAPPAPTAETPPAA